MDIELRREDWLNGLITGGELLMHTMVARRRLFEIETEILEMLRASEAKIAEEVLVSLGITKN